MSSGSLASQPIHVGEDDSSSCVYVAQRTEENAPNEPSTHVGDHKRESSASRVEDREDDDEEEAEEDVPYQETQRFRTWRKHTTHLYQLMMHIDLVWESPPVALMPYMSVKDHMATQTILCGTRTGGQEQNYLQFLNVTTPVDATRLDDDGAGFCDVTGEVGGFGRAPAACGMHVERRMYHNGDVLAARYMHANPLVLGTASSDKNLYVFDWSCVSLKSKPNDPERPRGPLPPNALSVHAGDDERHAFMKRMRHIDSVANQQQAWDAQCGKGQHSVVLTGHTDVPSHLDWNTSLDGLVASSAANTIRVWQVGNLSKTAERTVEACWTASLDDESSVVTDTKFSWDDPQTFFCVTSAGSLHHGDLRCAGGSLTELVQVSPQACSYNGLTSLAVSALQGNLIATGTAGGSVALFDLRNADEPVVSSMLHEGEVTCLQWSPHNINILATGGDDGIVVLSNITTNEVLFKHSGHTDPITDMQWCWQDAFKHEIVSVDRNSITLWRPRNMFLPG